MSLCIPVWYCPGVIENFRVRYSCNHMEVPMRSTSRIRIRIKVKSWIWIRIDTSRFKWYRSASLHGGNGIDFRFLDIGRYAQIYRSTGRLLGVELAVYVPVTRASYNSWLRNQTFKKLILVLVPSSCQCGLLLSQNLYRHVPRGIFCLNFTTKYLFANVPGVATSTSPGEPPATDAMRNARTRR